MSKLFVISFLLLNYVPVSLAQSNLIGFACGSFAQSTESVSYMGELLKKKNYDKIRKELSSKTPSLQFLSVTIMERLEKRGDIVFTDKEKIKIEKLYSSSRIVEVCSGCTVREHKKLGDLLSYRRGSSIKMIAEKWADRIIEKY